MSILDKITQQAAPGSHRPPAAIELAPEGVLAAAIPSPGAAPVYAFAALPAGALVPSIAEVNLLAPQAVSAALKAALEQTGPRSRDITLVVPDAAVRVFVLDFDSLPAKASEALPVLRFRMRKVVPFDVEQSAVSYQVLSNGKHDVKVLAAIMPLSVLAEYESAVRAAGYEPGAVLPSGLAALAAIDVLEPALSAHLGSDSLTTVITSGQDLLLYRTIELPAEPEARHAELQRGVAVAAAYYEDRIAAPPSRLHYSGSADAHAFAQAISETGLHVEEITPAPASGLLTSAGPLGFAAVAGSLAGAAA